jgi:hypothetical protein
MVLFVLTIHFSFSPCLGKSEENKKPDITLEQGLLSVEAKEISVESILQELGSVCDITIVASEGLFPSALVSVKFRDKPVEEGIKKILRVSRVKNYLLYYQEDNGGYKISRIEFLGKKSASPQDKSGRRKRK